MLIMKKCFYPTVKEAELKLSSESLLAEAKKVLLHWTSFAVSFALERKKSNDEVFVIAQLALRI